MKLNDKQFMPTRQITHRNQAWSVDLVRLDLAGARRWILIVIDVHTRRPLLAVPTSAVAEGIAAALERLCRRAGCPQEIWIDRGFDVPALHDFSVRHGVTIVHLAPSPQSKAHSEPILRDLGFFLRDKRHPTRTELCRDIERWRQRRVAEFNPVSNDNQ